MSRIDSRDEKRTSKFLAWVSFSLLTRSRWQLEGAFRKETHWAGLRPLPGLSASQHAPRSLVFSFRLRRFKVVELCSTPRKLFEKSLTKNFYARFARRCSVFCQYIARQRRQAGLAAEALPGGPGAGRRRHVGRRDREKLKKGSPKRLCFGEPCVLPGSIEKDQIHTAQEKQGQHHGGDPRFPGGGLFLLGGEHGLGAQGRAQTDQLGIGRRGT